MTDVFLQWLEQQIKYYEQYIDKQHLELTYEEYSNVKCQLATLQHVKSTYLYFVRTARVPT